MVPSPSHTSTRSLIREGLEKKKGSTRVLSSPILIAVPACQTATTATKMATWKASTAAGPRPRLLARAPGTLIAGHHLVAQVAPDALVDLREAGDEARLDHVARPWQWNRIVALEGGVGAGREEQDPVGEGNRLLPVVGQEEDRDRKSTR